jgi:uncharacterized membrane protein
MITSRSDDLLVGIIGLALLPWIGWTLHRGLRAGRLPIGRTYVRRDERRGAFNMLLALYAMAAVVVAYIALDLLLVTTEGSRS